MATYQIGSYRFELIVAGDTLPQVRELQSSLDKVLQCFRTLSSATANGTVPGLLTTPAGNLQWYSDQSHHYLKINVAPDLQIDTVTLVDIFEPHIINQAVRESSGHLWFHGACLVRGQECILLSAESGTGKTTLSLGLLGQGYRLLTDDIILIHLPSRTLIPVPRCPKIRPPADSYLRAAGVDLTQRAEALGRYVLLSRNDFQLAPLPLSIQRVYILQRNGAPGRCEEVDNISGLLSLLPRSNLLGIDSSLELAAHLFRDTRFFSMTLDHFPDDLAVIAG